MSLTRDALANARYRLEQMAKDIDTDPSISAIRITIAVNPKNRRVRATYVHVEHEYEPAPEGVLLSERRD